MLKPLIYIILFWSILRYLRSCLAASLWEGLEPCESTIVVGYHGIYVSIQHVYVHGLQGPWATSLQVKPTIWPSWLQVNKTFPLRKVFKLPHEGIVQLSSWIFQSEREGERQRGVATLGGKGKNDLAWWYDMISAGCVFSGLPRCIGTFLKQVLSNF